MTPDETVLDSWEGRSLSKWARLLGVERFEAHRSIGSTNDRVRESIQDDARGRVCIVADEQTAGRGRVGRSWVSPAGGIWCSIYLPTSGSTRALLPLVAGVAAARALEAEFDLNVLLKWPNDLILNGGKLGGILCESAGSGVVVGVGINVATPPGRALDAAALRDFDPTALTEYAAVTGGARGRVVEGLVTGLLEYSVPEAWPAVRDEWNRRDALAGRRVVCSVGVRGVTAGIDESGGLVVTTAEGTEIVRAGSVRIDSAV